jgi:hypothetical protein
MRRTSPLLLLLVLILTYFAYAPGLSGAFLFDDYPNIVENPTIAIANLDWPNLKKAMFSSSSGPLGRPISMASFALNYYVDGFNPYYYKLTNILIHLLNGIGIYALTALILKHYRRRFAPELNLARAQWICLAVSAAWLLHPLNVSTVLYVVQRMTGLSTLFSLVGLNLYALGRIRLTDGKKGMPLIVAGVIIFTALASYSKEIGALLPLLALILEFCLFQFQTKDLRTRRMLMGLFLLVVGVPAFATCVGLALHPGIVMTPYENRAFTLAERLMTEARVMCFYLNQIGAPSIKAMGIYHDDIPVSTGLLAPTSTALAIAGIAALLLLALLFRKKAPLLSFGILFFFAGHLLESTIFPLEITFEHRNYLPMYGILLPSAYYLVYPFTHQKTLRIRETVLILMLALFGISTYFRTITWSNPIELASYHAEHHPLSARSNLSLATTFSTAQAKDPEVERQYHQLAEQYFERAVEVDKNFTDAYFGLILSRALKGAPVETKWLDELEHRLRFSPFANSTGDLLDRLVTCEKEEICSLDKKRLGDLIQAALKNPTLTRANQPFVYMALAHYHIAVTRDYAEGTKALYLAANSSNRMEYRVSLIRFLIALEKFDQAEQQLAILKQADTLGIYADEIADKSKLLRSQGKATPPDSPH